MHHCIGSYESRIVLGKYYAYRMERPYRCTVGIEFIEGSWKIDQVQGIKNERISDPEVRRWLKAWLANSSNLRVAPAPKLDYLKAISKACGLTLRKFRDE
jgi:hypothetical protein